MALDKQAASQYVDDLIVKLSSAMESAGIKLSAEELASLALRKIAEDSEEGETPSEEAAEKSEEEKAKEKEEEEKKESAAKIASAYQLLQKMDKTASAAPASTTGQPSEQEKLAAFENSVVARAREFLVYGGVDPSSGKPLSKIALARTPEELRDAAAMELLETKGYPVSWPPDYLGRALGR